MDGIEIVAIIFGVLALVILIYLFYMLFRKEN